MAFSVTVKLNLPSADQLIKSVGLDPSGAIQRHCTAMIAKRLPRYMPFRSGALSTKLIHMSTDIDTQVVIEGPYAHYQYIGKVWVDPVTKAAGFMTSNGWRSRKNVDKIKTDRDLEYDTSKNPQAGPYWDRALVANEGDILTSELQSYINYMAGRAK